MKLQDLFLIFVYFNTNPSSKKERGSPFKYCHSDFQHSRTKYLIYLESSLPLSRSRGFIVNYGFGSFSYITGIYNAIDYTFVNDWKIRMFIPKRKSFGHG